MAKYITRTVKGAKVRITYANLETMSFEETTRFYTPCESEEQLAKEIRAEFGNARVTALEWKTGLYRMPTWLFMQHAEKVKEISPDDETEEPDSDSESWDDIDGNLTAEPSFKITETVLEIPE